VVKFLKFGSFSKIESKRRYPAFARLPLDKALPSIHIMIIERRGKAALKMSEEAENFEKKSLYTCVCVFVCVRRSPSGPGNPDRGELF
jgi:hypothetical protein